MFVVSRVNKSRDFNVTRPHPGYVACRHFQTVESKGDTRRIVVDCVAIVRLSCQLCLARSARIFSFAVVAFGK